MPLRHDVFGKARGNTMGWMDRLRGRGTGQAAPGGGPPVRLLGGGEDLEVVGESHYQEALWGISGARVGQSVRCAVTAVLVPEPQNAYDPNAIAVVISGHLVGY